MNASEDSLGFGLLMAFGSFVEHDVVGFRRGVGSYPYSGSNSCPKSTECHRMKGPFGVRLFTSKYGNSNQGESTSRLRSQLRLLYMRHRPTHPSREA